jgi:hypothetical protein
MDLVTRSEWGARPYRTPSGATRYSRDRRGVKLHYLGTPYTDRPHTACAAYVRKLQDSHMDGNGWSDIGYSFVVCTHGAVFEGRGLVRRNSANGSTSLNEQDYAVCLLVGSSGLTQPTDAQLHGARDAIDYCRAEGPAGTWLGGHRDGYATSCPGDAVYAWVKAGAPRPAATAEPDEPQQPAPTTPALEDPVAISISESNSRAAQLPADGSWLDIAMADAILVGPGETYSVVAAVQIDGLQQHAKVQTRFYYRHQQTGDRSYFLPMTHEVVSEVGDDLETVEFNTLVVHHPLTHRVPDGHDLRVQVSAKNPGGRAPAYIRHRTLHGLRGI